MTPCHPLAFTDRYVPRAVNGGQPILLRTFLCPACGLQLPLPPYQDGERPAVYWVRLQAPLATTCVGSACGWSGPVRFAAVEASHAA